MAEESGSDEAEELIAVLLSTQRARLPGTDPDP